MFTFYVVGLLELVFICEFVESFPIDTDNYPDIWYNLVFKLVGFHIFIFTICHAGSAEGSVEDSCYF